MHTSTPSIAGFEHEAVKYSAGEYVRGMAHTNGMESFWSVLKRGYHGTFHHFSAKHMKLFIIIFTVLSTGFVTAHGQAFWDWEPPYEIFVRNDSCKNIRLAIHYLDYNDDVWKTHAYYNFYPGEGGYLAHAKDRLQTETRIYYWAEYMDGSGRLSGNTNRDGRWVYVGDERVWMDGFWDDWGYDIDLSLGAEFSDGLCLDNPASIREGERKKRAEAKKKRWHCKNDCKDDLRECRFEFPVRTDANCAVPYRECVKECG